jgi:hypothetical protein
MDAKKKTNRRLTQMYADRIVSPIFVISSYICVYPR